MKRFSVSRKKEREAAAKVAKERIKRHEYDCSYYGWMSFPIDHIGKVSQYFGDAKSLYKIAKRVCATQLKCQQLHGAATSKVVVTADNFEVSARNVKLSQPLLSARIDTVISIVTMKGDRLLAIFSYTEDMKASAAIGVDIIQLDEAKQVPLFVERFNRALAASKESVPPGVGIKAGKPPPLKLVQVEPEEPSTPQKKSEDETPRSPGWAPDGLSRMERYESMSSMDVPYLDVVPQPTGARESHQWDTDSISSFLIDEDMGQSGGYLTISGAGRRVTGLGYISVTTD